MGRQAPMAPPRVRNGILAYSAKDLNRLSATEPYAPVNHTGVNHSSDRTELFNRLQQFYLKWEHDRINEGIGHIVDWVVENGEDALNDRLMSKYGEDLTSFEQNVSALNHLEPFMSDSPGQRESLNSQGSQGPTIRDRLAAFYSVYDPDRLKKGVDDLVDYVSRKGLPALNTKFIGKYGITLNQFEAGEIPPSPPVGGSGESVASKSSRVSVRTLLRRSFRAATSRGNAVPDHVKILLEIFYSKYDQSKITSGGVDSIFRWTKKNGIPALNAQLKNKYFESLDEFADRMAELREELVQFYSIHDHSKLSNGGVDSILRWGVRNGRPAINKQLRQKYQCDLDNKKGLAVKEAEPTF